MSLQETVVKDLLKLVKQKDLPESIALKTIECIQDIVTMTMQHQHEIICKNQDIKSKAIGVANKVTVKSSDKVFQKEPIQRGPTVLSELKERIKDRQ